MRPTCPRPRRRWPTDRSGSARETRSRLSARSVDWSSGRTIAFGVEPPERAGSRPRTRCRIPTRPRSRAANPSRRTGSSDRSVEIQGRRIDPGGGRRTAMMGLLGSRDALLRLLEENLAADIHVRGNRITLRGSAGRCRVRRARHPRAARAAGIGLDDHPGRGPPHHRHAGRTRGRAPRRPARCSG